MYIWICTQFALSSSLLSSRILSSSYVQIYIYNIHTCVYYVYISYISILHICVSEYAPNLFCHRHFWVRGSCQAHMFRYTYIIYTYVYNIHICRYVYIEYVYLYICTQFVLSSPLLSSRILSSSYVQIYIYNIRICVYYIYTSCISINHTYISEYVTNLRCHRHFWVRGSCQAHTFRYTCVIYTHVYIMYTSLT